MRIRPIRAENADEVAELARLLSDAGASDLDRSVIEHLGRYDAAGCWVVDEEGVVSGIVLSTRRDLLWTLAAIAVTRSARAVAPRLLEAALSYSRGCLRGMAVLPDDPTTVRVVRQAGFMLHPTMRLSGRVDRSMLPPVEGVREATEADRALVDSVDRRVRGAARGPDHERLAAGAELLVCDVTTGSGYAYHAGGSPIALGATTRGVARRLLWAVLARSAPQAPVEVGRLTAEQDWAVDVGHAAGLGVHVDGFLALRHMRPPAPYVPAAVLG